MLPKTKQLFFNYRQGMRGIAQGGSADGVIHYTPTAQQQSYVKSSENADFLKKINRAFVDAQLGERLGLGVSRPIASRTDTSIEERQTDYIGEIDPEQYYAAQTNFDIHLIYSKIDAWAHLDDFSKQYAWAINKQKARDRLMVGFHGTHVAKKTDKTLFPNLEDVNIGWQEKARLADPKRLIGYASDGTANTDTFKLGSGGDYLTLDALVFDLTNNLLDAWHQESDDLIVMVGREIWTHYGLQLLSNSAMPTERVALQTWFAAQTVAGLPCIKPPFFKSRGIWVTSYENLSIYIQNGSMRRTIIDNPKRDRVEEYHSQNEAYVVEDFGKFCGVRPDAILLPDGAGGWA